MRTSVSTGKLHGPARMAMMIPDLRLIFFFFLLIVLASVSPAAHERGRYTFTVTPAATGDQLIRTSLPLPRGFVLEARSLRVSDGGRWREVGLRALSWHPNSSNELRSIRRALVTFPYRFKNIRPVTFTLKVKAAPESTSDRFPVSLTVDDGLLGLTWLDGRRADLRLIAPSRSSTEPPRVEIVETNSFFRWQRLHFADPQWPRIIELRCDALGGVVLIAHVQRVAGEDGFAPELGWELQTQTAKGNSGSSLIKWKGGTCTHSFGDGQGARWQLGGDTLTVYHPAAPLKRRGRIALSKTPGGDLLYRYLRCTEADRVPMQPMSWQRIEMVLAPPQAAPLRPTLESPHAVVVAPERWTELYDLRPDPSPGLPPSLQALVRYHREAIVRSACVGDDWGNVTVYNDGLTNGDAMGMNRLNHCAPIFEEGWRSGDRRLLETAVLWCDNFFDQSIWWGEPEPGGTRYNNVVAMNQTPLTKEYMWRSNGSANFCTKGYDAFWLAWEQTGDPRMKEALEAQIAYAAQHLHADRGQCRNIGDVRDFVRLFRYTGERRHLDEALRLFRELRTKLSTGDLFDQSGNPIDPDPDFIEEDQRGLKLGYAKPYIIGYALSGLPELLTLSPDELKLNAVVRAAADFLSENQDPVGAWRYPHPRSSRLLLSHSLENAWQLTQAARALGPEGKWLDAIEACLRQHIHGWRHTGQVLSMLTGWELSTGKVKAAEELYELYRKPADRDGRRDYIEGRILLGSVSPEGTVYFTETLEFYLQHRSVDRILAEPKPDSPLGQVLKRVN